MRQRFRKWAQEKKHIEEREKCLMGIKIELRNIVAVINNYHKSYGSGQQKKKT